MDIICWYDTINHAIIAVLGTFSGLSVCKVSHAIAMTRTADTAHIPESSLQAMESP
jgi:hypothetical protein